MLTTPTGDSGGTGFVLETPSGKNVIVTNAHICDSGAIFTRVYGEMTPLKILEVSSFTDLCTLAVPDSMDVSPLRVSAYQPIPDDKLHVHGYGMLLGNTQTEGLFVSYIPQQILNVFGSGYATIPILPGNSGSPVLNESEEVVYIRAPIYPVNIA